MPSSKARYRLIPSSDPVGIVPTQALTELMRGRPVEGEAGVALAFVVALLRALRDRGTLAPGEVDDVLNDVQDQVAGRSTYLVESVRRELAREDDE
jgi:hypothetical protein